MQIDQQMEQILYRDLAEFSSQMAESAEAASSKAIDCLAERCTALETAIFFASRLYALMAQRLQQRASVEQFGLQCAVLAQKQRETKAAMQRLENDESRRANLAKAQEYARKQAEAQTHRNQGIESDLKTKLAELDRAQRSGQDTAAERDSLKQVIAQYRRKVEAMEQRELEVQKSLAALKEQTQLHRSKTTAAVYDLGDLQQRSRQAKLENASLKCQMEELIGIINRGNQRQSTYNLDIVSMTIEQFNADEGQKVSIIKQELMQKREREARARDLRRQLADAAAEAQKYERLIEENRSK